MLMEIIIAIILIYFVVDHFYLRRQFLDEVRLSNLLLTVIRKALLEKGVLDGPTSDRIINDIAGETMEEDWKKIQKSLKRKGIVVPSYMDEEEFEVYAQRAEMLRREKEIAERMRENGIF